MPLKRRRIALPVAFLLALLTIVSATPFVGGQSAFVRGEFNQDGRLDISDVVSILIHLFVESLSREGRSSSREGRRLA
ncbi:MAG: hypothetical protein O7J95_21570 [Planctomycetota bacterium]|nr:hypothetical protein [Planctomycetota bacterium]